MTLVGLRLALVVIAVWITVRLLIYARANRPGAMTPGEASPASQGPRPIRDSGAG
jgi:hypothetical protein